MALAFSTGDDCIAQQVEPSSLAETSIEDVDDYFEIPRVVDWILVNGFSRVALQFPDRLLRFCAEITAILGDKAGVSIFVLGDTSYGSCCVDEVAAQHGAADAIVHFGPSCLSPPSRLPVLFIFGKEPIDSDDLLLNCTEALNPTDPLLLFFDVTRSHFSALAAEKLKSRFADVVTSSLVIPCVNGGRKEDEKRATTDIEICNRKIILPTDDKNLQDYKIVYIGEEGPPMTNSILHFKNEFYSYDPRRRRLQKETISVNKSLSKRYFLIEKAKDANIIGVLAGTLGVANYLSIIRRIQDLIKTAGKKSYLFVVGKLNVPKLANFQEIDAYVLVACPENSLVDSRGFFQPILTPYELEVALNPKREWKPEFVTDFNHLLPGRSDYVAIEKTNDVSTDVSLITGQLRQIGKTESDVTESSLVTKEDGIVALNENSGAGFLDKRSWRGLEQNLGQTPVTNATEGTIGIAMGYNHEHKHS